MSTPLLNQTAPLVAVPSHQSWWAWVHELLHHVQVLQKSPLQRQEPSEKISHHISILATPLRFSRKGVYTSHEDWYGYR
jgi:hypothetical protein